MTTQRRKTALVTGGARGIGRAIAEMLVREGYDTVILCHKSEQAGRALAAELCNCTCVVADVADAEAVEAVIADIIAKHGGLDVLINNAGIAHSGLFTDLSRAEGDRIMAVNFGGVVNTCRAAYAQLVKQKAGVIVNIASIWGEAGASCEVMYSASKGAVIAFSKALAQELAPSGVRVACVSPGVIDTDMMACYSAEDRAALKAQTPCGRLGTPQDVADAVRYLLGAGFVTGCVLRVDGGFLPFC